MTLDSAPTVSVPTRTSVKTAEVMGTVATIQVVYRAAAQNDDIAASAIKAFVDGMRADQKIFTTYDDSSVICQLGRGELTMAEAPEVVREVEQACQLAKVATDGRFDAWWRGWFDPTGYVKGWSAERQFFKHLAPAMNKIPEIIAVAVNVGGDMQVATKPGSDWRWQTGIANPFDKTTVLARFALVNGAVATSGTAERGAHIFDPLTGAPIPSVDGGLNNLDPEISDNDIVSATVIAESLTLADMWATAAVVAGFNNLDWIVNANTQSGLIVARDGRTRRWAGTKEID